MPNSASARKSMRKAAVRRERNRSNRSALRTVMKKARAAAAAAGTDAAAATEAVKLASKKLDQSAASHLIHKNAAARLKSRLSRLLKRSAAAKTPAAKTPAAK
jgi:small subunit ribosomal protein S20